MYDDEEHRDGRSADGRPTVLRVQSADGRPTVLRVHSADEDPRNVGDDKVRPDVR
jgi:hypothetical protein